MLLSLLATVVMVFGVTVALAWPLTARMKLLPAERLLAAAVLSLLAVYLCGFARYVAALPAEVLWLLPALAAVLIVRDRRSLAEVLRDATARELIVAQLLVSAWCLGLLALINSYSGGGWIGDWFGHWQRMQFFIEHWPRDTLFNGFDPVTSRPPLVNLITGAFVIQGPAAFAGYQTVTTLLSTFAFLPAALLAHRFGGRTAIRVVAVLVMLSPFFVQNATFAWTKLPTAFFVLAALHFFLRSIEHDAPRAAGPLCGVALGAALLAHYSAAPYAIVLAIAWCAFGWRRRREAAWWQGTAVSGLAGGLLLATWFGWAVATYGARGTFLTNTSVTDQAQSATEQAGVIALNLRDTLVPHFLRAVDYAMFNQPSSSGWWRDWFFQLYQVNLPFAFGSVGAVVVLLCAARAGRGAAGASRTFWSLFAIVIGFLGIAAHAGRDTWGLAHICLQPLVLVGLAVLAAGWGSLARGWKLLLVAGVAADFALGIALHFGVQSGAIDRWLAPERPLLDTLFRYSAFAQMNLRAKLQNQWTFVADLAGEYRSLVPLLLAGVIGVAICRASRGQKAHETRSAADAGRSRYLDHYIAVITGIAALGVLWTAWCEFPRYIWNELRVAPAFALRFGVDPYPPAHGGPLSTWIYGPVGMMLNLPATWAASAEGALQIASLLNALTVLLPMAIVFFGSAELRARGAPLRWLALALGVLLLPRPNLTLQVADHAAIAFGLLSGWVLAREARPSGRRIVAVAALGTLAIWAKQVAVFVALAHVVYLWIAGERRSLGRYVGWMAAFNALALGACVGAFGFDHLWLNLVGIPGKLPWAEDLAARLAMHAGSLVAQIALPAIAILLLRVSGRWPGRERESGRFWLVAVLTFWAVLPVGLASLLKYGGNTNVLHSWAYFLPAALLLWLARDRVAVEVTRRAGDVPEASVSSPPRLQLLAVAVLAIALRWPDIIALPRAPETAHYTRARELAALWPQGTWFPNNPLVTFYADGRLWHTHDGIVTRDLAGLGLRERDFRRHIPADLRAIVYPKGVVFPVALQLLPEFNQTITEDYWAVHHRGPMKSVAP